MSSTLQPGKTSKEIRNLRAAALKELDGNTGATEVTPVKDLEFDETHKVTPVTGVDYDQENGVAKFPGVNSPHIGNGSGGPR